LKLREIIKDYSPNLENIVDEQTYIKEILPLGGIVGDRINTTKNKKLTQ
jgi:hypothetical protein